MSSNARDAGRNVARAAGQAVSCGMCGDRPPWDQRLADLLDGAVVLVGMTDRDPQADRLEQVFGTVIAVDRIKGVVLRLGGSRSGDVFHLPPDLRPFRAAAPGSYRLRAGGDVVEDPDYIADWTVTPRPNWTEYVL